jgi:hypothetical protein
MKRIIGLAGLGVLLVLVLFGCMGGVSKLNRLETFAQDLSLGTGAARADTYLNFHPTLTQDVVNGVLQGEVAGTYFWDGPFPDGTYTISVADSTDDSAVLATIDGPLTFTTSGPLLAQFSMDTYNMLDYRIVKMWLDTDGSGSIDQAADLLIQ